MIRIYPDFGKPVQDRDWLSGQAVSLFDFPPREKLSPAWASLLSVNARARALGPLLVLNAHGWSHLGLSHAPVLASGSLPEAQTLSLGAMWWPCPQPWLWLCLLAVQALWSCHFWGVAVPQPLVTGCPQPRASLAALYQTPFSPSLFGKSHLTEHLCNRPKSAAWSEFSNLMSVVLSPISVFASISWWCFYWYNWTLAWECFIFITSV